MASIVLQNVTVDFRIYGLQYFRTALKQATGGLIRRSGVKQQDVTVRALEDVSIMLKDGDRLGIIGHNGAGKSTLLRVCAGVFEPTGGFAQIEGKISPLFNTAPGLDPDDTGFENIVTCGLFLGMTRDEIDQKLSDIEQFSELGDYLNLPVRTYSTGMQMRLGFSLATALDPEILILDEGLSAGDARFAERATKRVEALVDRCRILVLASHSTDLVRQTCNTAILLNAGRITAAGEPDKVIEAYHEMVHAQLQ